MYGATLRLPLILRGPGVTPGTRLGAVARTIDLFPTILDVMGVGSGRKMTEAEHAFGEAVKREPTNGLYRYNHGLALQ